MLERKDTIILEGKWYSDFSHPNILIWQDRLGYDEDVGDIAETKLNLSLQNTATQNNDKNYIDKIKWELALKLNLYLNGFTPNLAQFNGLLKLLKTAINNKHVKVYNGEKERISHDRLKQIYGEILAIRDPYRAEWLDADFKFINGRFYLKTNHILDANGNLMHQNLNPLEKCLMEICDVDINSFNSQGMPTRQGKNFTYWPPLQDNISVARFNANSRRTILDCYRDPAYSVAGLGVRRAEIFEE